MDTHCILEARIFKAVMRLKLFMTLVPWGLVPLLIPAAWLPTLGLNFTSTGQLLLRLWGVLVILVFFVYLRIYRYPHQRLTRFLLLFGVIDNTGLGLALVGLTIFWHVPFMLAINAPFGLLFGYWFWRFYRGGVFI